MDREQGAVRREGGLAGAGEGTLGPRARIDPPRAMAEEQEARTKGRGDDRVDAIGGADDRLLRAIDDDREAVAGRDRDPSILRGRDARAGVEFIHEGIALRDGAAGVDDEERAVLEGSDQRAVTRKGERDRRGGELDVDLLLASV